MRNLIVRAESFLLREGRQLVVHLPALHGGPLELPRPAVPEVPEGFEEVGVGVNVRMPADGGVVIVPQGTDVADYDGGVVDVTGGMDDVD